QDQSAAAALQQLQAELDEINERGFVGLPEISRAASVKTSTIASILFEFDGISVGQSHESSQHQAANVTAAAAGSPAPLVFSASSVEEGFRLQADLSGDFCAVKDLKWLVRQTCSIVEWIQRSGAASRLTELNAMDEEQHTFIMNMARGPLHGSDLPSSTSLQALFEHRVSQHPKKIAVQCGSSDFMTYEDLNAQAHKAAMALAALGIGRGSIVPICMKKSSQLLVAIFAVLKAGAAFTPLDPANPSDRKARIIEQCGPATVIVDESWNGRDLADVATSNIASLLDHVDAETTFEKQVNVQMGQELAYCIFTSGSTGLPKGVMVEHAQIISFIESCEGMAKESKFGRRLNFASTAFDATVGDVFGTLSHGATLIMASTAELLQDIGKSLADLIITNLLLTPTFATPLASDQGVAALPWTATLLLGGEKVEADLRDNLCSAVELENAYGPTEASVQTLVYPFPTHRQQSGYVPIGKAVGWSSIYVLEPDSDKLLPVGAVGELCIGGPQVARGYLNDEAKTKAKFVSDPFVEGGRMFRT
ncbi:hypothetical protein OC835_007989, partial [Tilletia horrida]